MFNGLRTMDEKEQFIEQFWRRRDPDMRTAINEYKEEHYRRIAYANDHFFSAKAGWRTDRGRTYILWGPPDDREMRPSGGRYERLIYEGRRYDDDVSLRALDLSPHSRDRVRCRVGICRPVRDR